MNTLTNSIEYSIHHDYHLHDVQINEEEGSTIVTTANVLLVDTIESVLQTLGYKFKNTGNCAGLKFVIEI